MPCLTLLNKLEPTICAGSNACWRSRGGLVYHQTSDMDGASGEHVRLHHHIILPRVSFEAAAKAWKDGSVEYQILQTSRTIRRWRSISASRPPPAGPEKIPVQPKA